MRFLPFSLLVFGLFAFFLNGSTNAQVIQSPGLVPVGPFVIQWDFNRDHVINNQNAQMTQLTPATNPIGQTNQRFSWNGLQLKATGTNNCIDVVNGQTNVNGALIMIAPCDNARPSQRWFRRGMKQLMLTTAGAKCLQVGNPSPAFNPSLNILQINDCDTTNTEVNQQFNLIPFDGFRPSQFVQNFAIQWASMINHIVKVSGSNAVMTTHNVATPQNTVLDGATFQWAGYQIKSPDANMCLDVFNGNINTDGSTVIFARCDSARVSQQWIRRGDQLIQSKASIPPKCLEVLNGNNAFDTPVMNIRGCAVGANQQFNFLSTTSFPSGPTFATIANEFLIQWNRFPDHVLDGVEAWMSQYTTNQPLYTQRWVWTANDQLQSVVNGKCLTVDGSITTNGTPLSLQRCDPTKLEQKWIRGISGVIQLKQSSNPLKCVNVQFGNPAFNTRNMILQDCDFLLNQQFNLVAYHNFLPFTN